ncbi:hypothetical protein GCM10009105_08770 [Dokdonella soli]|uniref:Peptidase S53 domain-containing protein n=1 Tax=Dokdonella soli TaxID=529810 RepID=A0ABN1IDW2_9GAMM
MSAIAIGTLCLGVLVGGAAHAAGADRIVGPVDNAQRTALSGHRALWAQAKSDQGAVPADLPLAHLSLTLNRSPERQQAFDRYLQEQQDPASPNYHRWLTPAEIGERFGASQHDIDALSGWLGAQGLKVDAVASSRTRIHFSGSTANVGAAFGTELHYFQAGAEKRIANTDLPKIPAAFANAVQSVTGLSAIKLVPAHRMSAPRSAAIRQDAAPQPALTNCPPAGGPCSYAIFPADFSTIYDVPVLAQGIDGSGQTIAIVGRQRVYNPDIQNFQSKAGLATKYPTVIVPTTGTDPGAPASTCSTTGTPSCSKPSAAVADQGEATLDVQRASSVAPGAAIDLIVSTTTNNMDGVFIAMDYAIDTNPVPAKILSISFASCEADATSGNATYLDNYFSQAAMEGISVFVASGDGGVAGCASLDSTPTTTERVSTNLLCSSGHVTCVGGTEFADRSNPGMYWGSNGPGYGSALGYIPEGAWNEPLSATGASQVAASGGGVSAFIPTPSWQAGPGVPGRLGRYTPDVSFASSIREGYFTCIAAQGGSCVVGSDGQFHYLGSGGTSASTPSMAGIAALLNQKTGSAQANLNPRLYALAATPANGVFHDVTVDSSGVGSCTPSTPSMCNNSTPGPSGLSGGLQGYAVGPGYDQVTGLGSIDVSKLLAAWGNGSGTSVNLNQHGMTGSWANPATSGQGLVMEVDPDFYGTGTGLLFAGWYTYDVTAPGGQRWYTIQGQVSAASPSSTMPIYLTQGGRFASSLATTTAPVGQATIQFSDCTHGSLNYTFSDGSGRSGTIPLSRLDSNVTCGQTGNNGSAASDYLLAGAWADIGTSGQGLVLDINPLQNLLFAGWYTFATNAGQGSGAAGQNWYTLQAIFTPGSTSSTNIGIYNTTGGVFNQAATTSTVPVGSASLVFHSCNSATLSYAFTAGANAGASGSLNLSRIGPMPAGCTL